MIEIVEESVTGSFPPSMGMKVIALSEGYAKVEMRIREDMLNVHGSAHGGVIFALADTTLGLAVNARVPAVTLQASINYIKTALLGQVLTAVTEEEGLTRSTGIYNVTIKNEAGEIVALCRGLAYKRRAKTK